MQMAKEYRLGEVLISRERIAERVAELAREIALDNGGRRELLVVGILTGAVFFLTDLVREMPDDLDVHIDFMSVSSYADATKSSGVVRILHDLKNSVEGIDVLIVEDIVDTGLTLSYLQDLLRARRPASLRTCVLLDATGNGGEGRLLRLRDTGRLRRGLRAGLCR